ncbi:protein kinase domain containing protein [Entamoeba histolytica HM-1:IMSS]|uniref:Protein kinase domain containing protein n=3 Tax=Entamoeba histolytica TaxID=5759 RepID=C4MA39_ENTH1|nr:protein kinase domain containing protein [Entamoeba histolytica HM-1:IMSS]EAL42921.2 protein kinase domain containing protein [Entamoeba histolytica HM-1:IMSS]EMD48245.1 protein kinase domain containing protein [Entamoeba histolytica KU27]ENY61069.1 protein kinase domain containing protein [Entamoeba histolytica HM-1:IMSS-A]|eukprot:XP_648307.2 protein kinase domain containing protein [Entamoeba histolytica HM-1:IMSS]
MIYLLLLSVSFATLVNVTFNPSMNRVIIHTYIDEYGEYPYTFITSHLTNDSNSYSLDGILPFAETIQLTLTTREGITRPNVVQSNTTVIAVHNKVFEIYDISKQPAYLITTREQDFDKDSDMTLVHRKQGDIIFLCKKSLLNEYNIHLQHQLSTNIWCGKSISGGNEMIAVKGNRSNVNLYEIDKIKGELYYYGSVSYPYSETFNYDPIRMNKFNVLYAPITGLNRLQVNSPNDFYRNGETIIIPFYNSINNSVLYNPTGSQIIYTYGSLIIIGTPFINKGTNYNNGGAILYYDYYLTDQPIRFKKLWEYSGNSSSQFAGWSVGIRSGYVFIGGAINTNEKGIIQKEIMINITEVLKDYSTIDILIGQNENDYIELPVSFISNEDNIYCSDDLLITTENELAINKYPPFSFMLSKEIINRFEFSQNSNFLVPIKKCCIHPNLIIMTDHFHTICSSDNILNILLDVAKGLDELHKNNFIHQNITLDSFVVDSFGNGKLSDYWIPTLLTTSIYTPPEVLNGLPFTKSGDVFSFAIACILSCGGSVGSIPFSINNVSFPALLENWKDLLIQMLNPNYQLRPDISSIVLSWSKKI